MDGGNRLFAVEDRHGKKQYFDLKGAAKKHRNALKEGGFSNAQVTYGPDHPKHHSTRKKVSWNKGLHPKRSWRGSKAVRQFSKSG